MAKTYKLYVWERVFCDYTCGIAFAVAKDVAEARSILKARIPEWDQFGCSEFDRKPKIVYLTKPYGNYTRGGG